IRPEARREPLIVLLRSETGRTAEEPIDDAIGGHHPEIRDLVGRLRAVIEPEGILRLRDAEIGVYRFGAVVVLDHYGEERIDAECIEALVCVGIERQVQKLEWVVLHRHVATMRKGMRLTQRILNGLGEVLNLTRQQEARPLLRCREVARRRSAGRYRLWRIVEVEVAQYAEDRNASEKPERLDGAGPANVQAIVERRVPAPVVVETLRGTARFAVGKRVVE